MPTHLRQLSSARTFMMKVIAPLVSTVLLGALVLVVWLPVLVRGASPADGPPAAKWIALLFLASGSILIWLTGCNLKQVWIDQQFLHVSNYLRDIKVPLGSIDVVTANRWSSLNAVTIRFHTPTAFGQKIVFMPQAVFPTLGPHPVVEELRNAAHIGVESQEA